MMEQTGVFKRKRLYPQYATNSRSAKGRMIVSSVVILLSAMALFLGIVGVLCFLIVKCGFFAKLML